MNMENKVRKVKDRLGGKKTLKVTGILEEFEKDDIKKNIDITELFQDFGVKLHKKGKNWMGVCPWHKDKTPSLSVDREKGLYNCFGCGESGDAFDLVEKMKGYNFKDALNYLKSYIPSINTQISKDEKDSGALEEAAPEDHSTSMKEETKGELQTGAGSAGFNLNTISEYYHKRLYENPKAIDYLKQRGLKTPELYERYQIGFADGSLLNIIGETQRNELIENGILNRKEETAKVWEHFNNCLIFPILDENGQPISFYGRDISEDSSFKHRYLKGSHKGIWNRKASKVYADELILTESIIDALSLIELGFQNVQPIYGTNGLTDEHLQTLKDDRVKTVILALDNDPSTSSGQAGPGQKAAESIKERLVNEGFKVKILNCYGGKDWNEALVNGKLDKEELKTLIESLAIFEQPKESGLEGLEKSFKVSQEGYSTIFKINEIVYKVAGAKETFVSNLRVNIKAQSGEERFFDTLDLYSARARGSYANQLSRLFGIEPKRVEKDLSEIVDYFETDRDRRLEAQNKPEKPVLTEEEKRIGLEFLQSPDLFQQIVRDMEVLGYIGEDLNKQLMYLCASSRILDDPISVMILSESASGKSMLADTVKKLIPPEDVLAVTSLSDQALNYIKDLMHKFLVLGEAVHSDNVEHSIREMLSGKELSRLVTTKDEKTGKMDTELVARPTVVASVMSSTAHDINPENASRCFVINADESKEQTRRIHESQRGGYSIERYITKKETIPTIVKKHHAAQRLLKKIIMVNPFSKYLDFPDSLMRTRRDNGRFLDLIVCVCFLRQYQKPARRVSNEYGFEYIECDLEDYKTAYPIMVDGVLASTLLDIPKGAVYLYDEIRQMLRVMAEKTGIRPEDIGFIQRDIREYSKFSSDSIRKYLQNLVDLEYIQIVSGRSRGTRLSYRLRKDEDLEKIDLSCIPTPEEMTLRLKSAAGLKSEENGKNDRKH